jgi:hypothetical protein
MLQRLSQDWEERWGHPIVLVETFADPRYCQGAACKVSGWSHLGKSAGWKRDADDFYEKNDAPKQIRVRELVKKACLKLRARQLPAEWAQAEQAAQVRCAAKVPQIRSRMETLLKEAPEFRRAQALAYPLPGLVALMVMAAAQGALRGPQDLADYADTLSQGQKQFFPPQATARTRALKRERNRGRLEIRFLECVEVTPPQVSFPGARLAARLQTRVRRKGKWSRAVIYLLSSNPRPVMEVSIRAP